MEDKEKPNKEAKTTSPAPNNPTVTPESPTSQTLTASSTPPKLPTATQSEEKQVWDKDQLSQQIRRIDEQISVALKQHGGDEGKEYGGSPKLIQEARADWNLARVNLSNDKLNEVEKNLSDSKDNLIEVINKLRFRWRLNTTPQFGVFFQYPSVLLAQ